MDSRAPRRRESELSAAERLFVRAEHVYPSLLKLTGAASSVSRDIKLLPAAPVSFSGRFGFLLLRHGLAAICLSNSSII
jgi:hypothetical protein